MSICYDLYSLETFASVRGKVTHLFVPAFNRDITTFDALAEAGMRLLFANVVVANNGYYGGSVAVAPFYNPHHREVLRFRGNELKTAFRVRLPLDALRRAQKGITVERVRLCQVVPPNDPHGCEGRTEPKFKELPADWGKFQMA